MHQETAVSKNELGLFLLRRGDLAGAESLQRDNVAITLRMLGPDHPNTGTAKSNLGLVLLAKGDTATAEALTRETLAIDRRVFGDKSTEYARTLNNLGGVLEVEGRLDEAQALLEEGLAVAQVRLGNDHPRVLGYVINLARVRVARGDGAAMEPELRHVLSSRERLYPAGDWRIAQARSLLGAALMARAQYAEAEPLMLAAARTLQPIAGAQERERAANRARLVELYRALGRPQQAAAYR
jgi:tetratricopeptide (TPR) repeat protein